MRYRVHQLELNQIRDRYDLEAYLNGLEGKVISVLPDFLARPELREGLALVIERIDEAWTPRRDPGEKEPEEIVVP
jgi:hypothetical protein